mmetsp:Transcript_84554/g.188941  ORF Transcript_84554/g.188941 Transcript_84554/m.188941 type:complete len:295 (-) Transcript_84554:655-1539(-)
MRTSSSCALVPASPQIAALPCIRTLRTCPLTRTWRSITPTSAGRSGSVTTRSSSTASGAVATTTTGIRSLMRASTSCALGATRASHDRSQPARCGDGLRRSGSAVAAKKPKAPEAKIALMPARSTRSRVMRVPFSCSPRMWMGTLSTLSSPARCASAMAAPRSGSAGMRTGLAVSAHGVPRWTSASRLTSGRCALRVWLGSGRWGLRNLRLRALRCLLGRMLSQTPALATTRQSTMTPLLLRPRSGGSTGPLVPAARSSGGFLLSASRRWRRASQPVRIGHTANFAASLHGRRS